ncbi:tRNA (adenosine(37)-N6)-threonylcarbamoyltransferase complex ATPase subunit type 1 TsaE [Pseudoxanthomonas dokdonensis]|uniref:tRNA threonylcarbamoyladenosine biosynthesis protein TsaE n=1 Tax=Pseudoxanthomonas dokdonensis TaxID=344882 RepID=A0A0R0CHJ8_9GAMM|nr:tRNA (adenosine(37)-N6)-threonylcarbamoyltransferase complex ATPase subunit type 1 TsaE [Pseudoxanthomonas dokdonensis]KRG68928.1 ATP-binding protein [Pseudoxanthomonas dokdonensis]
MQIFLSDSDATDRLGQMLAASRPSQAVLHLQGDLGAGKSTLARALLRALGVSGPIRSPTYTLIERYPLDDGGQAWHLDLYRIGDAGELEFLGLDEAVATLWLVEWPERGSGALPAADLRIHLQMQDQGRQVELCADSAQGTEWLQRLANNMHLPRSAG